MVTMTRRVTFSAAHADWLFSLSRVENEALFGPMATPEPYGHNYVLDVTVGGEIDAQTGIIVNIKEIDRIVKQHVVQLLDRKFINRQVNDFCGQPTTLENLTEFVREKLQAHIPPQSQLTALRLEETPLYFVEWRAEKSHLNEESEIMLSTRVYEFAASHRLHSPHLSEEQNRELFGKCNYVHGHGHNYILEVTVSGKVDPHSGRVIDPGALDAIVNREVVERYDHRHFNYDIPEFAELIPSSEAVTKIIWERLQGQIPAPVRLHRVVVRETARNFFEYSGEEDNV